HLVATRQGGLDEVAAEAAGRTGDEPDLAHDVFPFFLRWRSRDGVKAITRDVVVPRGSSARRPDDHEAPATRPL
ncbi:MULTISPECIES: hypothetical protein, partial [unclassified Nonomuraea]